jgi:PKHD-type hydroxylase
MLVINPNETNWSEFLLLNNQSPPQFQQYCWTSEEIEEILNLRFSLESKAASLLENNVDYTVRKVSKWPIPNDKKNGWIYNKVCQSILATNSQYWKLDIDFIETIELLQYSFDPHSPVQDHYRRHCDFGGQVNTRKLSYSALLTDEYTGGELKFFLDTDFVVPKEKGQVAIFPSYLYHQVFPILSGTRISLVAWASGRQWR